MPVPVRMEDEYDDDDDRQWDDTFEIESEDGVDENPQQVLSECLEKFRTQDYIMEPGIFMQLKRYFQAGGNPEQVIHLLSSNYKAVAQMTNLTADWLLVTGLNLTDVQALVENHLKDMIVKTFDPKKADTIFTEEGKTPSWLPEMIQHPTWRSLIYKLAEEYPDCLMLNFTIKLISDAGYQAEITSISTAAQQMEVFSSVLKTAITNFVQASHGEQTQYIQECARMVCHGKHTFVYSSVLLQALSQEGKGGVNIKRLLQEISKVAQRTNDVTAVIMALAGAAKYTQTCQALSSMISRNCLNPADITVLYRNYTIDPPPVDLIRNSQFLELLIDCLFKPNTKLNPEHKSKYIYLLAYAASVYEVCSNKKTGGRKIVNKDELKATTQAIDKVHTICINNKGTLELISEITTIFQHIRYPVVCMGIIRWVECTVMEPSFFKLCTEHTPIHLVLLDEVVSCHPLLHSAVFKIFIKLFESKQLDLDVLVELEIRKMLLDRMVNLVLHDCVVPVIKYINQCWKRGDTDMSLIRYFVTEVLEAVSPSYSSHFVQLFLPIVENDEITGTMRCGDGDSDPVSEFIVHCKGMLV